MTADSQAAQAIGAQNKAKPPMPGKGKAPPIKPIGEFPDIQNRTLTNMAQEVEQIQKNRTLGKNGFSSARKDSISEIDIESMGNSMR